MSLAMQLNSFNQFLIKSGYTLEILTILTENKCNKYKFSNWNKITDEQPT